MAVESADLAGIYDVHGLLEYCMGDVEFAEELLERFESRLATTEQALQSCLLQGDRETACRMVHSLKGEAGMLAAARLQDAAGRLEAALRTSHPIGYLELLDELQVAVDQCLRASGAARDAILAEA